MSEREKRAENVAVARDDENNLLPHSHYRRRWD